MLAYCFGRILLTLEVVNNIRDLTCLKALFLSPSCPSPHTPPPRIPVLACAPKCAWSVMPRSLGALGDSGEGVGGGGGGVTPAGVPMARAASPYSSIVNWGLKNHPCVGQGIPSGTFLGNHDPNPLSNIRLLKRLQGGQKEGADQPSTPLPPPLQQGLLLHEVDGGEGVPRQEPGQCLPLAAQGCNPSPSQGQNGRGPVASPELLAGRLRVTSASRKTNSMRGGKSLDPFPQPWFKTSIKCMCIRERMSSPRKAPAPTSPCRASRLKEDFAAHPHGVGARHHQGSGGVRVGGVRLGRFGL